MRGFMHSPTTPRRFLATRHRHRGLCCAIVLMLALSATSCDTRSGSGPHESLTITSRTIQNTDDLQSVSTPTSDGRFIAADLGDNNALTVASSTSRTDAPQWAIDITLSHSPSSSISWPDFGGNRLIDRLNSTTAGALVVSPNGDYVSIAMQVEPEQQSESGPLERSRRADTARQRRGYVIVLDAKTGRTVLTREVSGFILAQALSNDHLAVETAEAYFPAGEGRGTITTLPLNNPSSPTTIATDQW